MCLGVWVGLTCPRVDTNLEKVLVIELVSYIPFPYIKFDPRRFLPATDCEMLSLVTFPRYHLGEYKCEMLAILETYA